MHRTASAPVPDGAGTAEIRTIDWRGLGSGGPHAAWDTLAAKASEPNPFYESWYLLPSLRALEHLDPVELLSFEDGGEMRGLLPVTRASRYYRWPVPHMRGWVHANCFIGAPLVAAGHEPAFWRALFDWADRNAGQALFLHLGHIPLAGPLYEALLAVLAKQNRAHALVHREERALLSSDLSPGAYLEASLSGRKRKELRRQYARLSELGALVVERHEDAGALDEWVDAFLALEAAGWKGEAGSALASSPETTTLFRETLRLGAVHGKLLRLSLTLDGAPIAMLVSFFAPPGAFSFKTAFDERYARFSPGVLLQLENLTVLEHPGINWADSCAAADHPMIDHIWRERREVGRISIAIGGTVRRWLFDRLVRAELGRNPTGLNP
jgi:CelD/BcsL family acetyltransferase involved in cellulose biosynthesis